MKVRLEDVIGALVLANDHADYYYYRPTGKIICIYDPLYRGIDVDEELEDIEDNCENYIKLPNAIEIHAIKCWKSSYGDFLKGTHRNVWNMPYVEKGHLEGSK